MASPKPPAPSSRVLLAFLAAAVFGGLIFLVVWLTEPAGKPGPEAPGLRTTTPGPEGPGLRTDSAPAVVPEKDAVPRGGQFRGLIDADDVDAAVTSLTQAALVRVNRSTDQLEPWLAESWTTSSNTADLKVGPTYNLKLRGNVLWSNGAPFTADDVAYAIGSSGVRAIEEPVTARVLGPLEVALTFPGPFAPGMRLLARIPIVSKSMPEETAGAGLGPFVLRRGLPGPKGPALRTLVFERNPHYWRMAPDGKALPYIDRLELDVAGDRSTAVPRLLSGELDFIDAELRPEDNTALKHADHEDRARLYDMGPGAGVDALRLNLTAGPKGPALRDYFAKDDFRLAISAAVNRREFCEAVYKGACDPVVGPVPPGNAAWFSVDLPVAGPDPAMARSLLAGLGLQDRNSDGVLDDESGRAVALTVLVSRSSASAERGAAFVRDQLKDVGVRLDIVAVDPAVLAVRLKSGQYDAIFGRIDLRDTDPAMNLDFWIRLNADTEWARRINELMLKQATTGDRVERVQLFADVQRIYAQHMPDICFAAPYTYVATNLHMLNVKPSRRHAALLWNAETLARIGR